MTSTTLPTRRKALKLFAGVPLLPGGAAAAFRSEGGRRRERQRGHDDRELTHGS